MTAVVVLGFESTLSERSVHANARDHVVTPKWDHSIVDSVDVYTATIRSDHSGKNTHTQDTSRWRHSDQWEQSDAKTQARF